MIVEHAYVKKALSIVAGVCFVVFCLYTYTFYEIRDQTRDSLGLLETLERDVVRRDKFEGIEKTLKNLEEKAQSIDSFVVTEDGIVSFLEVVEELALEQGVELTKKIEKHEDETGSQLRLTLSTQGSWEVTQNMLALIENLPYSITVHSFSARVTDEEGWLGTLEFSVASNS